MSGVAEELRRIVAAMVDAPDAVEVHEQRAGREGRRLELQVAPDDMGVVIGRDGRTASALRTLLDCRGDRRGGDYDLKIREPGGR